jgi:hypothetical protein
LLMPLWLILSVGLTELLTPNNCLTFLPTKRF